MSTPCDSCLSTFKCITGVPVTIITIGLSIVATSIANIFAALFFLGQGLCQTMAYPCFDEIKAEHIGESFLQTGLAAACIVPIIGHVFTICLLDGITHYDKKRSAVLAPVLSFARDILLSTTDYFFES